MKRMKVVFCSLLFVGGVVLLSSSAADEKADPPAQLSSFESIQGGFRVNVPKAWHIKEILQDEIYQGYFSRERVEKEGDLYTYGLSVLRLRDYRTTFQFTATTSDMIAIEYAARVAGQLNGGKGGTVVGLPTGKHGSKLSKYLVIGGEGAECVMGQLLIVVKGKKWFHALWEAPCSEAKLDHRIDELSAMVKSLWVEKKWGL
jgi:hypothetical protein